MDILPIHYTELLPLKDALGLVRDVFWEFNAPGYTDEGVWEFDSFIEQDSIAGAMQEGRLLLWGAYAPALVGVLAVRPPCHVSLMFVAKAHHRQGVAKALLGNMVQQFRAAGFRGEATVHSSPYAVEAYRRMGFAPMGPAQTQNGIRFVPMRYPLR